MRAGHIVVIIEYKQERLEGISQPGWAQEQANV